MLLCYITDRKQFRGDEGARRAALLGKIAEAVRCGVDFIQLREKDLSSRELESLARAAVRAVRENSREGGTFITRILINSRTDVAIACGADGVHLTSTDVDPADVRSVWCGAGAPSPFGSGQAPARENAAASPSSVKNPHPFAVRLRAGSNVHHPSGPKAGPPGTPVARSATLGWGAQPIIAVSCHSVEDVARAASAAADFVVFAPVFEKRDAPHVRPAGLATLRDICRPPIPVLALGGVTLENASPCIDAGAAGIAAIRLFQENDIADVVCRLRG